jgi:hypothetical protein
MFPVALPEEHEDCGPMDLLPEHWRSREKQGRKVAHRGKTRACKASISADDDEYESQGEEEENSEEEAISTDQEENGLLRAHQSGERTLEGQKTDVLSRCEERALSQKRLREGSSAASVSTAALNHSPSRPSSSKQQRFAHQA